MNASKIIDVRERALYARRIGIDPERAAPAIGEVLVSSAGQYSLDSITDEQRRYAAEELKTERQSRVF